MHRVTILLFPLFLISCSTGIIDDNAGWKPLKSLKSYQATDFHLSENIDYLEIRQYTQSSQTKITPDGKYKRYEKPFNPKDYEVTLAVYRKPLSAFSQKIIKAFKAQKPVLDKTANLKKGGRFGMMFSINHLSNVFAIEKNQSFLSGKRTNSVFPLLGKIDTPAEVQMALWLHNKHAGKLYRKIASGYEVIIEYNNSLINDGECGWFKYKAHISEHGVFLSNQLLEKKESQNGCAVYD